MSDSVIVLLVMLDIVVLGVLFYKAIQQANHWPDPAPRPHGCDHCWRRYPTGHLLSLHLQAEHAEEVTYEGETITRPFVGPLQPDGRI